MTKRALIVLIGVFVISRGYLFWATDSTLIRTASGDVALYETWAEAVLDDGRAPYSEVDIEYPPGSLPFVFGPEVVGTDYRAGFAALMLTIDLLGAVGLYVISRRTGDPTGLWVWTLGVFLLGPITYMRLDLVPAVATIWGIEALHRGASATAGGWWGLAVAAKLYPAALLPAIALTARRAGRFVLGLAALLAAVMVPFAVSFGDLWNDVVGYHWGRGLQLESSWAAVLQIAGHFGHDVALRGASGGIEITSAVAPALKTAGLVISMLVLAAGTVAIVRAEDEDRHAGLYGLAALLIGVGTVLSPQFILWLLALGAAAVCVAPPNYRTPILAVLPIAFATQLIFPAMWISLRSGAIAPLLLLVARNGALIAVGVWVLTKVRKGAQVT